ncbi:MAG: type II toxin-antitoxin system VapC family toxin [Deinococcota bacterium]|nr:type II toxin-antitoxin system VapC family toxin [Deinococcota bacterium]
MSGRFLLDTNIIIALFAKEDTVMQKLANAEDVFVPSIALGELYFGAGKSARAKENTTRIDEFAANGAVLFCDTVTAKQYGAIKNQLKVSGSPIPENDIWIAAIAAQYQLILVTRDSHFQAVEGLQVEQW